MIVPATESDLPLIFGVDPRLGGVRAALAPDDRDRAAFARKSVRAEAGRRSASGVWKLRMRGICHLLPVYSTFLAQAGIYLEDWFVRPHLRGRGIGQALLARVAQIAVERHCGRIEWGVLNWNLPSIAFYQKLGAVPMDEWTKYCLTADALERAGTSLVYNDPRRPAVPLGRVIITMALVVAAGAGTKVNFGARTDHGCSGLGCSVIDASDVNVSGGSSGVERIQVDQAALHSR